MTNMSIDDNSWPDWDPIFIPIFTIKIVDGAGTQNPETNLWTKWRMSSLSSDGGETSSRPAWAVKLEIVRSNLESLASSVQYSNEIIEVPMERLECSSTLDGHFLESVVIHLDKISERSSDGDIFTLQLFADNVFYDVGTFQIRDFQMKIQVENENYTPGQIVIKEKKQEITGSFKKRLQRLDLKLLEFSLSTNVEIRDPELSVRGFVKRINDMAMVGKEKAVAGATEVFIKFQKDKGQRIANDVHIVNYFYYFTVDLDPEAFYEENPGKELYTSDKSSKENNIFVFNVCIVVDGTATKQEVYRFKTITKSKGLLQPSVPKNPAEYSDEFLRVAKIEAEKAKIKDLTIMKMTTDRGDIGYAWGLMNQETAGRYEEGDVVGLFPDLVQPSDMTYIDLLTTKNFKDAIVAGVVTQSCYLNSKSQIGGTHDKVPNEKLCMAGIIHVKVSGPVKHGDFIFASNKLPGVAVTQEQLIADKDDWRMKRLLGYSLETTTQTGVKLVNCIVSILLSINNDQAELLLNEMKTSLLEEMEGIRDDIKGFQNRVTASKKASRRRKICVCFVFLLLLVTASVACYIFLCPSSFYNTWNCHRGSLPGTLTFELFHRHAETPIEMEGVLYTWVELKYKLDLEFVKKQNFTGSYYMNLKKCQSENLRKVLGWFSSPPLFSRVRVFAVDCNCTRVFHYQKYRSWREYKHVIKNTINCKGEKGPRCKVK